MEYHILITNSNETLDIPITNSNETLDIILTGEPPVEKALNPKEEVEVLNGLFIGNHIYETIITAHISKLNKITDKL